jgi:hypothetical protein
MGGAIAGALGGSESIPTDWSDAVVAASETDIFAPAHLLAQVASEIARADLAEIDMMRRVVEGIVRE